MMRILKTAILEQKEQMLPMTRIKVTEVNNYIQTKLKSREVTMALKDDYEYTQAELDNHANQLNDNNDAFWDSRGYDGRPDDWEERDE